MHQLLHDNGNAPRANSSEALSAPAPLLLDVLWRRRWTLVFSLLGCLLAAGLYLLLATRVYVATARVIVDENGPKVFNAPQDRVEHSDNFLPTQTDVFLSTPVLSRAVDASRSGTVRTFADVTGDPVAWLRKGHGLQVEVSRRSDVIDVSMESPYPAEAVIFVNALVNSYVQEQTNRHRSTGSEMLRALQAEKQQLQQKRDTCLASMLKARRDSGMISFGVDKGNTVLERTASLSTALTAAELITMELQAQQTGLKEALARPDPAAAFAAAEQLRGRELGDHEYDELGAELIQYQTALSSSSVIQGPSNKRIQGLQAIIDSLKQRLADKQRSVAQAEFDAISSQLAIARSKENDLRSALKAQQDQTLDKGSAAAEYQNLVDEAGRLQKQLEALEGRIAEVQVDGVDSGPLNVQILEPARANPKPIKPNKTLTLAAAVLAGWVLGLGLAMLREWQDVRLRSPDEVQTLLGTPVLAAVPRINARLSSLARGQMVHLDGRSPAAEAYRSMRTALRLGIGAEAKIILLASPTAGDGKSTTASNLAIALAQAGERTLLLEGDLREPVQHLIFEAGAAVGLSGVMSGEHKLREAIQSTHVPGLYLLPCGPVPENPSELLNSKKFARMLSALSEAFDRIVIDSPPLLHVTDGQILAAAADVTLLVLRMNRSQPQTAALALEGLGQVGAHVLGVIANDVPSGRAYPYYGGSWRYAARADRQLVAEARPRPRNGKSHGADLNGLAADAVTHDEPDWSAELRP
jgi:capsular exopolysaccharide synthesis family protein